MVLGMVLGFVEIGVGDSSFLNKKEKSHFWIFFVTPSDSEWKLTQVSGRP